MFSREQKQQQLEKAEKKLIKLEELQSNFVNAIENRLQKTKRSSKRKLESADCPGCTNKKFGCDQCKLADIGKRIKLADDAFQRLKEELRNFQPESPPIDDSAIPAADTKEESDDSIVLVPLTNVPKSEPNEEEQTEDEELEMIPESSENSSNSTDPNEAENSYEEHIENNIAENNDDEDDDEDEEDGNEPEDGANEQSFEMWMPAAEEEPEPHPWCPYCMSPCKELIYCIDFHF